MNAELITMSGDGAGDTRLAGDISLAGDYSFTLICCDLATTQAGSKSTPHCGNARDYWKLVPLTLTIHTWRVTFLLTSPAWEETCVFDI